MNMKKLRKIGYLAVVFGVLFGLSTNLFAHTIWSAVLNPNGSMSGSWVWIPGSIPSAPAVAWNPSYPGGGRMQMVVQGEGNTIWKATFNSSGTFMSDWQQIPGAILDTPALAWNQSAGKMQMVVRGGGNSIWACSLSSSGGFNNDWIQIPGAILDPPALTWIPDPVNKMLMVVRGTGDTIWAATFNSSGNFEGNWTQIPGAILSTPALACSTSVAWMVVQGGGNTIWKASISIISGTPPTISFNGNWENIPGAIFDPVALTWSPNYPGGGRMQMVVRGGGDTIWKASLDSSGAFMNDWQQIPGAIFDPVALATNTSTNNMLMVVRGGEPFTGYWTGQYQSDLGGSGDLALSLTQNESTISGSVSIYDDLRGWVTIPFSGTASGNNIYVPFYVTSSFTNVTLYGTLSDINHISGYYYTVSRFENESGTFTLSR
jgi:hypothetical protein